MKIPVNFIVDHMLQTLVVSWSEEDLCVHLSTSEATIEYFVTSLLIFVLVENIGDLILSVTTEDKGGFTFCTVTEGLKGVASPISPLMAPTFDVKHSNK